MGLQELDQAISTRFATVADEARVQLATAALEENGINVLRAGNAAEAKRIVMRLIPDGSQVHHAASKSLEVTRITHELETSGRYEALRPRLWSTDRRTQAGELRGLASS